MNATPNRWLSGLLVALVVTSASCKKTEAEADPTFQKALPTMEDVGDEHAALVKGGPDRVRVPYTKDDAIYGAAEPLVTIVEFSDFQCPFCGRFAQTLHELQRSYPDDVRLVFKQFPLPMHPNATPAAKAAIAASAQGKFWAMHDHMFAHRTDLGDEALVDAAGDLGMDEAAFKAALAAPETQRRLEREVGLGKQLGVRGTPAFFVNGRKFSGAMDPGDLSALVEEERAFAKSIIDAGAERASVYAHIMRASRVTGSRAPAPADPGAK